MENRESLDIDVNRYAMMFQRQWQLAIVIFATTVGLSIGATKFIKPSYEASGKLLFRTPTFKVAEGQEGGDLRSLVGGQNPINNQIEVIFSAPFLQQVIDRLNLKNKTGQPLSPDELVSNLTLKIVGGTDVLKVSYSSRDPEETASVINTVMSIYLENDIRNNTSEAAATREFLNRQLPKNKSAVNYAELELRQFKQNNNIVDLAEEMKAKVSNINSLDTEINSIASQLKELQAQLQVLRSQIGINTGKNLVVINISQSVAVQEILKNLQAVEIELANKRSIFLEDNPIIINLEEKRNNLRNILQQQIKETTGQQLGLDSQPLQLGELRQNMIKNSLEIEVQQSGLSQKLDSLLVIRSSYEKRIKELPQLEQRQHDLERKLTLADSAYQGILKQIQDLQLAVNKNTANGRIIAKAIVPKQPSSGKKALFIFLGVMFGIFFSVTTVFLIELRDKNLKTVQEIREKLPYTLLGTLPLIRKKHKVENKNSELIYQDVMVLNSPKSQISEMYRMIQANLKFLSSDKVLKSVVITSAVSGEGKSIVSANLAAAIAQLGRKVLLIDADMRISCQQKIWKINSTPGLSDILIGEAKIEDAVWTVFQNLDILPAGVKPPNPLALIDSNRMTLMINELHSQYDFIIIDSPPFLLAADAFTLGQMSDGIILVARPGVLDYNSADKAKELLQRSDKNILGLVVNGIITKNEPSDYFVTNYYVNDQDVVDNKKIKTSGKKYNHEI